MEQWAEETGREASEWLGRLIERVSEIEGSDGAGHRRVELLKDAEARGVSTELAEQAYDIALEENVDPALAIALVESGIGVQELEPPHEISEDDTHLMAPPDWVGLDPASPAAIAVERRLRATFRRLRAKVDANADHLEAIRGLAADPDVGPVQFEITLEP